MSQDSALESLTDKVRTTMTETGTSPDDRPAVTGLAQVAVDEYQHTAALGAARQLLNPAETVALIVDNIVGYGPLDKLVVPGQGITDIFIEGSGVRVDKDGHVRPARVPATEAELQRAVERMLAPRYTLDKSHPIVPGVWVLNGNARLAAAIPPAAPHFRAAIRLKDSRHATLADLQASKTLSGPAANLLELAVLSLGSILISGRTGSGKSTVLAALLAAASPNHNVQLLEESEEIDFRPVHGGRLQCVPRGAGGDPTLAETLRDLIRESLRWKPDIIAVGETRDAEAFDLAHVARVGAGFCTTIHSDDAAGALDNLVLTALNAGPNVSERHMLRTFARAIQFVVHCERDEAPDLEEYLHQVVEIRAVNPLLDEGQGFSSTAVFERPGGVGTPMVWTGVAPPTPTVRRLESVLRKRLPGATLNDVLIGSAPL